MSGTALVAIDSCGWLHNAFVILTGMEHGTNGKEWFSAAPLVLVLAADLLFFVVAGGQIPPLPAGYPMLCSLGVVLVAAAAVLIPNAVVRTGAAFLLGIAGFLGAFSAGIFYLPAAIAAALAAQATPRGKNGQEEP
ncbi:MAG TPA: hypothetical protein VKB47_08205 [Terracidiphilus sp.]|nr:hypothetical protein [Terracidiphilus sp.]